MPEEETPQTPEIPAETPSALEEDVPAPDSTSSPQAETAHEPELTAQTHGNEPFDSTQDKPFAQPETPEVTPSQAKESPRAEEPPRAGARERSLRGNARKQERARGKIARLMAEIEKRGKISNDEVEKLLHVSDATAARYLAVLVKEGKIKQDRKTGAGVAYTKI